MSKLKNTTKKTITSISESLEKRDLKLPGSEEAGQTLLKQLRSELTDKNESRRLDRIDNRAAKNSAENRAEKVWCTKCHKNEAVGSRGYCQVCKDGIKAGTIKRTSRGPSTYAMKKCEDCENSFTPTGPSQKRCVGCKDDLKNKAELIKANGLIRKTILGKKIHSSELTLKRVCKFVNSCNLMDLSKINESIKYRALEIQETRQHEYEKLRLDLEKLNDLIG